MELVFSDVILNQYIFLKTVEKVTGSMDLGSGTYLNGLTPENQLRCTKVESWIQMTSLRCLQMADLCREEGLSRHSPSLVLFAIVQKVRPRDNLFHVTVRLCTYLSYIHEGYDSDEFAHLMRQACDSLHRCSVIWNIAHPRPFLPRWLGGLFRAPLHAYYLGVICFCTAFFLISCSCFVRGVIAPRGLNSPGFLGWT